MARLLAFTAKCNHYPTEVCEEALRSLIATRASALKCIQLAQHLIPRAVERCPLRHFTSEGLQFNNLVVNAELLSPDSSYPNVGKPRQTCFFAAIK